MDGHPKSQLIVLYGVDQTCPLCFVVFPACEHCWRGNKYCGSSCSGEARRGNRRASEKKYAATDKGQASRRLRQKNFRARSILELKVTDHSTGQSISTIIKDPKPQRQSSRQCWRCRKNIRCVAYRRDGAQFGKNKYFSFTRFKAREGTSKQ